MKTLRTIPVPQEKIAAVAAELDQTLDIIDEVAEPTPDTGTPDVVDLTGRDDSLRRLRKQVFKLRRSIQHLLGTEAAQHLPEIIVGNYRAAGDLKRSYAQAQVNYAAGILETEYDSVTGVAIARALVSLFSVAGYNCRNWTTFIEQHSLSTT